MKDKGFIGAIHLRAGDILVLVNGQYAILEKVQHEILEAPIKVYNFEVEGYHTYFVGDCAVLVHNVCEFDTVAYKNKTHGMDNHHGIIDSWMKKNVSGYVSRSGNTPTMALYRSNHKLTTKEIYNWLDDVYGTRSFRKVHWENVSPREIFGLSERMFDVIGVPQSARIEYYSKLTSYLYSLG